MKVDLQPIPNDPYGLLLEEYLEICRQNGNAEWTMWFKRSTCEEFISEIQYRFLSFQKAYPSPLPYSRICTFNKLYATYILQQFLP